MKSIFSSKLCSTLLSLFVYSLTMNQLYSASSLLSFDSDGYRNNAGVITNGMRWGILVDTNGSGFNAGAYEGLPSSTEGYLLNGGVASDDYYFENAGKLTTDNTGNPIFGAGGFIDNVRIVYDLTTDPDTNVLDEGMNFALLWSDGNNYGLQQNPNFVIPGVTISEDYQAAAQSASALEKTAQFTFTAVPEPSAAFLALLLLGSQLVARNKKH